MQKEVLIHVRGLQMMDAQGDQEPIELSLIHISEPTRRS